MKDYVTLKLRPSNFVCPNSSLKIKSVPYDSDSIFRDIFEVNLYELALDDQRTTKYLTVFSPFLWAIGHQKTVG